MRDYLKVGNFRKPEEFQFLYSYWAFGRMTEKQVANYLSISTDLTRTLYLGQGGCIVRVVDVGAKLGARPRALFDSVGSS